MRAFNHTLAGSIVGVALKNPLAVIPVAVASHLVMDVVPHFDDKRVALGSKGFLPLLIADAAVSVVFMVVLLLLFPASFLAIIAGIFGALLPDFIWIGEYLLDREPDWRARTNPFTKFHSRIQWSETTNGAYVEILWPFLMLPLIWLLL